ncbi:hypothetical protein LPH50_02570 [Xylella taiwanensis]|uniref:Uncharacterized protein n=1 Tax=Xylella taiwanensis TaxID=1444770 RepID=Z9JL37_9GAMM|nr:hypothetical protein [Xylella taiwanensis]EWS79105.1 hypothetical protein AF72_02760 [Xylella taiwanensis]MCD8457126.1 hypothetical protein [Xylella taiwanensis]MCD8459534.1 hypothetical protein [Xylella taiwanensis]MCD8461598.1 hypothetical protein [Xylella taiwanensis]MCD8462375.1 hypothetical protein [Xylella taiwanensis]
MLIVFDLLGSDNGWPGMVLTAFHPLIGDACTVDAVARSSAVTTLGTTVLATPR